MSSLSTDVSPSLWFGFTIEGWLHHRGACSAKSILGLITWFGELKFTAGSSVPAHGPPCYWRRSNILPPFVWPYCRQVVNINELSRVCGLHGSTRRYVTPSPVNGCVVTFNAATRSANSAVYTDIRPKGQLRRVQQLTGRIGWTIGTACWTTLILIQ